MEQELTGGMMAAMWIYSFLQVGSISLTNRIHATLMTSNLIRPSLQLGLLHQQLELEQQLISTLLLPTLRLWPLEPFRHLPLRPVAFQPRLDRSLLRMSDVRLHLDQHTDPNTMMTQSTMEIEFDLLLPNMTLGPTGNTMCTTLSYLDPPGSGNHLIPCNGAIFGLTSQGTDGEKQFLANRAMQLPVLPVVMIPTIQ